MFKQPTSLTSVKVGKNKIAFFSSFLKHQNNIMALAFQAILKSLMTNLII
jgi:hypothetical protein